MSIKRPPALISFEHMSREEVFEYLPYSRIVDDKGRYLPWDDFRHRISSRKRADIAWTFTRLAREGSMQKIDYRNESGVQAGYCLIPVLQEACELVDKHATGQALEQCRKRLQSVDVALEHLQMDEAITSSQLEGASTTTRVARDLLQSGRKARTEDEQMIVGNARLMQAITMNLNEPLSVGLIRHFHNTGMAGINDELYTPGELRTSDDIFIADYQGDIVHRPPTAALLDERLEGVCRWYNDNDTYIHPLIRACMLHFMLAHEHPFNDGNGRTSRALFYWSMLKSGYDAFKYVSISRLLYGAQNKYAYSYQHTETDNMDLTYFLVYQAEIVSRAVREFLGYVENLIERRTSTDRKLFASGALARLSQRQVTLINIMLTDPEQVFTAALVSERLGVSDNTARNDLKALVREGLAIEKKRNDQQTIYQAAR